MSVRAGFSGVQFLAAARMTSLTERYPLPSSAFVRIIADNAFNLIVRKKCLIQKMFVTIHFIIQRHKITGFLHSYALKRLTLTARLGFLRILPRILRKRFKKIMYI